jgi:RCC1 and BTB domain-containing protein
MLVNISVK